MTYYSIEVTYILSREVAHAASSRVQHITKYKIASETQQSYLYLPSNPRRQMAASRSEERRKEGDMRNKGDMRGY